MTNRFASARKFASKIVESKNLIPPIDPVSIIKSYGIEIIEDENQFGIEAFSELGEKLQITINTEFTFPARKRFTLAHELGHIMIPWHNGDVKCDTDTPYKMIDGQRLLDTQELEANIFASELLMPHDWLVEQIKEVNTTFQNVISIVKDKAQTSIMACLYALEDILPPGNLYYVQKSNTDYWKKFSSERTYTTQLYYDFDERINFLDCVCEKSEKFSLSQYEIIYYKLSTCPETTIVKNVYSQSADIVECINILTNYEPIKSFLFLKDLLNSLDDVYCCAIFENEKSIKSVAHFDSKLSKYWPEYSKLIETLDNNLLEYYVLTIDKYKAVFIKEKEFDLIPVTRIEPNSLLRVITSEIYPDNPLKMLQRINGVVSSVNSSTKFNGIDDERLIYNIIKYHFAGSHEFSEFYNHSEFDTYIINKVRTMLQARKTKK